MLRPLVPFVPFVPFWASTTGVDHSPAPMVSVAPVPLAGAMLTYSGLLPLGGVADQPFVRPVRPPVAKV